MGILKLRKIKSFAPDHTANTQDYAWMTPLPPPYAMSQHKPRDLPPDPMDLYVSSEEAETVYPWVLSDHTHNRAFILVAEVLSVSCGGTRSVCP